MPGHCLSRTVRRGDRLLPVDLVSWVSQRFERPCEASEFCSMCRISRQRLHRQVIFYLVAYAPGLLSAFRDFSLNGLTRHAQSRRAWSTRYRISFDDICPSRILPPTSYTDPWKFRLKNSHTCEAIFDQRFRSLGLSGCYMPGIFGESQNLIEFCERIASDTSLAFQLSIFGAGSEAGAVRDWIARSCDGRFSFEDFLPEDRFVQELLLAEVFVITEVEDAGSSFIPSKLIPAICAGTPILAVSGARSPLAVEVSDYDLGVVTPWSDAGTGVDTIRRLVHDPVQRAALALSLSGRARAYGREAAIQRMATMLSDLTGKN